MLQNLKLKLKILLKNSFILFILVFLVACSAEIKDTIEQVDEIDAKYNVALSNYENGLTWFDTNVREPTPLNSDEIDELITELNLLKQGKEELSLDYIEFRINLFQAEKLYKIASRRPFASYKNYIRCDKKDDLLLSYDEAKQAVDFVEKAMELYPNLKKYIEIDSSWLKKTELDNEQILGIVYEKEDIVIEYCNENLPEQSEN